MKEVARLLNDLRSAGVITNYALFGALAQVRYAEPVATVDADVLVVVPSPDRLDVLSPIHHFCSDRGYRAEGEAVRVGAWPVQFVPLFSDLTREAVEEADEVDFEGEPLRVVRPDHLAVIALAVGRPKDFLRILALLEAGSTSRHELTRLATRHGLSAARQRFATRFLDA